MLAQSFLPAADLGITEPQRSALMKTLVLLETGKLDHVPDVDDLPSPRRHIPIKDRKFSGQFNMADWSLVHNCGTVCCIGGTAELIGGLEYNDFNDDDNPGLHSLFYPRNIGLRSYSAITPAQAATALRSYLTVGDAKWHEAVSGG